MVARTEKGKKRLICARCCHEESLDSSHIVEQKVSGKPMDEVVIIDRKSQESLPIIKAKCSRCGNEEAVWWIKQMRSGDEPPTIFYRCTKCRHTWRQY
ncbi:MAG: transcription factor S [Candidatus Aenigmarchaeota archaeon]|nr:transcription factor S [Candidatus Aenigmarchaeota archaeon]